VINRVILVGLVSSTPVRCEDVCHVEFEVDHPLYEGGTESTSLLLRIEGSQRAATAERWLKEGRRALVRGHLAQAEGQLLIRVEGWTFVPDNASTRSFERESHTAQGVA
jgi:hypothetical protein